MFCPGAAGSILATMASDLAVEKSDLGSLVCLKLEGTLNETFAPQTLAALADGRPMVIDLGKVSRLTSFGVRQWINELQTLRAKVPSLILENCSYACVSQLNMIKGFAGDSTVLSVVAPMVCPDCDHETKLVVDVRNGPPAELGARCSKCGADTELEEDPETFFYFAASHKLDPANTTVVELVRTLDKLRGNKPAPAGSAVATTAVAPKPAAPTAAAKSPPAQPKSTLSSWAGTAPAKPAPKPTLTAVPSATSSTRAASQPAGAAQPTPASGASATSSLSASQIAEIAEAAAKATAEEVGRLLAEQAPTKQGRGFRLDVALALALGLVVGLLIGLL